MSGGGVVRELVALFSARMDNASFQQVESRIFRLRTAVGGAAAAFATHTALEWGEMAARFEGTRSVFVQAGGDLANLRKQTRGLVSDMSLVKDFNFAQQFGFGDRLPEFFKIANAAAKKFGIDKEEALKKLIFGIALRSTPLLKNVGINVKGDAKAILEAYASLHGLQAKTLTHAQQAQAYADEAIKQGAMMVREVGEAGVQATDSYGRMHASIENLRVAFGRLVDSAVQKLAPAFEIAAHWIERISQSRSLNRFMEQFATALGLVMRVAGPFASVAMDLVRTFALIPGAGYLVAAMLLGPLHTGFVSTVLVLGRVVPGLTFMFNVLRNIGTWLPAFIMNAKGLGLVLLETQGPLLLLSVTALLAALALEELFAVFDDKKLGLIESFAGRWGDLVTQIDAAPSTGGWGEFFKFVKTGLVDILGVQDLLIQSMLGLGFAQYDFMTGDFAGSLDMLKTTAAELKKGGSALWAANVGLYEHAGMQSKNNDGSYYLPNGSYYIPSNAAPYAGGPLLPNGQTTNIKADIHMHGQHDSVKAGHAAVDRLHKINRDAHEATTPSVPQ